MVLQIQGMYHNIVVKEGRRPGKVVFIGDERAVKQSKAELKRILNMEEHSCKGKRY